MTVNLTFIVVAVTVAAVLFPVLRSGMLREKYAALWIMLGVAIIVLGLWPDLLQRVASLLGVQLASNLLFFLAVLLLLGVALHLSMAVSRMEEEIRTLAEEVAILRLDLDGAIRPVDPHGPGD